MPSDELRQFIRDVLTEEMTKRHQETGAFAATSPRPRVRQEHVSINNDKDLMAFVERLLTITKDGKSRSEIEQGRWIFCLTRHAEPNPVSASCDPAVSEVSQPKGTTVYVETGLVTERQVDSLGANTQRLVVGKRVRFTPLASDILRRRNISVERKASC
ncbi:hypothetical protein HC752_14555 [Vibrio sp. S9_S30]|uniref:hypothetical protein n=1 Tax=Vibrio sp. S9_S30 TaxID=2720226 RepID=UPI00167FE89E|nr:hypothetical protein [Vibrio sp. S9_S30]MBD1558156.1 hypothetical protein [Vibrio sp. S9_S30]